ncbi:MULTISPECIES: MFS transporter [Acinetobacter]|uniref:MFS transporter n=1 Tax=Acinetobacter TaxID=469 RepID=UPI0009943494|nr:MULTISPECIES: MFS transporter [Acinetobacter]MCL6231688.1 MFS transporter [Acinetobacter amyesii]MCL6235650.1 MFS transporter [Acinetobacter amyesii]MCL6244899.1 MFS transporter [Acinetobacter amyesii]OOV84169.1 MFS transporter [Acinetobacter sp. ANC 5600]
MTTQHQASLWNKSFVFCLCNNLFLFSYYFALLTILPIYIMKELGGSIQQAGMALTLFLVSSIAIRPFSGMIIERFGKANSVRISGFIFVVFALSYLWIDSMWSLLVIRFLHGFWFSILTTVNVPIVNDYIPDHRKGEGMGYFVMSTNLGVVIGPFLALSMIQFSSFSTLFAVLALLVAVGYIFTWLVQIQEHVQHKSSDQASQSAAIQWRDVIETRVLAISFVALLTAFAYSSVMSFITAYAELKHLLAYTSIFFIVFAVSMLLVRPWVGKVYDRKGPSAVIYPSFICFAIGLVVVSFLTNQWVLWISAVFMGIGYGSVFPCLQTVAIQTVEKARMGHAISTFFALFDIGLAVGSVIMGVLIAYFGFQATYLFCAVMVLFTTWMYRLFVANQFKRSALGAE